MGGDRPKSGVTSQEKSRKVKLSRGSAKGASMHQSLQFKRGHEYDIVLAADY